LLFSTTKLLSYIAEELLLAEVVLIVMVNEELGLAHSDEDALCLLELLELVLFFTIFLLSEV
jgi:hypothetical protein